MVDVRYIVATVCLLLIGFILGYEFREIFTLRKDDKR